MKYLKLFESKNYEICSAFLFRDNEQPLSEEIIELFHNRFNLLFNKTNNKLASKFYNNDLLFKIEIKQYNNNYILKYSNKEYLYYECKGEKGLLELLNIYLPKNLPIEKFSKILLNIEKKFYKM